MSKTRKPKPKREEFIFEIEVIKVDNPPKLADIRKTLERIIASNRNT